MKLIHISEGGPNRIITDGAGKRWEFEMHPYCGPIVITQRRDIMEPQPGPKSPFWHAVTQWAQQGHQFDVHGHCKWSKPEEPRLVHLGGRHYAIEGSALAEKALQNNTVTP